MRFLIKLVKIDIGGWGVLPTGKSISVSVAFALRACVRACEAVCGRVGRRVSPGLGRKIEFSMVPRRRAAAPPPGLGKC